MSAGTNRRPFAHRAVLIGALLAMPTAALADYPFILPSSTSLSGFR